MLLNKNNSFDLKSFFNQILLKKSSLQILKKTIFEVSSDNFLLKEELITTDTTKVVFVVSVRYTPVNTFLQVSDCSGHLMFYYSAGNFFTGKQKASRFIVLKKFFNNLFSKFPELQNKPVALHLVNVFNKSWLIKYIKTKMFITVVKDFTLYPHNGCRNKKIKRKKYKKKLRITVEKWSSGLWRQIVNLLSYLIVGSNPTFFN